MIKLEERGFKDTVKETVSIEGPTPFVANHTTKMTISPGNKGIRFTVPFENEKVIIPVDSKHTKSANGEHTTLVANSRGEVRTVEHLLSTLQGFGIDSCEIELEGSNQVPVKDASATAFTKMLFAARTQTTDTPQEVAVVTDNIVFQDEEGSYAILRPSDKLKISAVIQFPGLIGEQYFSYKNSAFDFFEELSWARSFIRRSCNSKVWELCRNAIPALPEDITKSPVLVFNDEGWIVPPLKDDEPVRHKILDALGDLRTLGYPIVADILLVRPGHEFNRKLVNYLACLLEESVV